MSSPAILSAPAPVVRATVMALHLGGGGYGLWPFPPSAHLDGKIRVCTMCWPYPGTKSSGPGYRCLGGERSVCTVAGTGLERFRVGAGSKGPRQYDGQGRILAAPTDTDGGRYLLFRRSCTDPTAWQDYVVGAPQACDLATLAAGVAVGTSRGPWRGPSWQGTGRLRGLPCRGRDPTHDAGAVGPGPVVCRTGREPGPAANKKSPGPDSLATFKRIQGLTTA